MPEPRVFHGQTLPTSRHRAPLPRVCREGHERSSTASASRSCRHSSASKPFHPRRRFLRLHRTSPSLAPPPLPLRQILLTPPAAGPPPPRPRSGAAPPSSVTSASRPRSAAPRSFFFSSTSVSAPPPRRCSSPPPPPVLVLRCVVDPYSCARSGKDQGGAAGIAQGMRAILLLFIH